MSPASFSYRYGCRRPLHSFPTRRSSDLAWLAVTGTNGKTTTTTMLATILAAAGLRTAALGNIGEPLVFASARSEEHTSELQSLTNLVCRLLLEKKKNKIR